MREAAETSAGDNASVATSGLGTERDPFHGRVVDRQAVVAMAQRIIVIRPLADERGAQARVASERGCGLPEAES
jgi:hypothetical protein